MRLVVAELLLLQAASGLVFGPIFAHRLAVRSQPLAMVERDAEGYIKEDALGDWTELKKSTARPASSPLIQPTLPDPPSPPRPATSPSLSLSRALTAPHPIEPFTSCT